VSRHYVTDTNLAYPTDTVTFEKECDDSHSPANGGTTHGLTMAGGALGITTHRYGTTTAPHNSTTWPTTGWGVSVDVQAAGADITYRLLAERCDPSQNRLTSTELLSSTAGTGVKSTTAQAFNANGVGGLSANDVLGYFIVTTNSNMMTSQSFAIYYSDSDSWVENTNFVPPAGGLGGTLGVNTETDSPIALTKKKVKAAGVNTESDAPQALARSKRKALGVNTETETPQALGRTKVRALGVATETDAAQPITQGAQFVAVNTVTETDTPVAVTRTKRKTLGVVTETDAAVTLGKVDPQQAALGTNLETDSPLAVGRRKVKALGVATETDAAQTFGVVSGVTLGTTLETDTPVALSRKKVKALGTNAGTDASQVVARTKRKALGTATETETPQAVSRRKTKTLGIVLETETALSFTGTNYEPVNPATETDSAQTITRVKRVTLGTATETDSAQSAGKIKVKLVTVTTETDEARPISTITPLVAAEETDDAVTITPVKRKAISPATETETVISVARVRSRTLGVVTETETLVAFGKHKRGYVLGLEVPETAMPFSRPNFRFEPPNFLVAYKLKHDFPEKPTYLGLHETFSVVRKNGTLTQVKSPSNTELLDAGEEGRDWFLGGRIYTVPQDVAHELTTAGFTPVAI
jgi:hypothetical protein